MASMKVCIIGASGKLGRYMVQHALHRGYSVNAVCREQSAGKLDGFRGRIKIFPGATNDREVIRRARTHAADSQNPGGPNRNNGARPRWRRYPRRMIGNQRAPSDGRVGI